MLSRLLVQSSKIKQSRLTGTGKCFIILPLAKRNYSAVQSCDRYERGNRSIAIYRGRKCFKAFAPKSRLLASPRSGGLFVFQIEYIELLSAARVKVFHRHTQFLRMVRWCIRLTRLTLLGEVIRYRLVQVRQNLKKRLFWLAARNRLSVSLPLKFSSSSYFLSIFHKAKPTPRQISLYACRRLRQSSIDRRVESISCRSTFLSGSVVSAFFVLWPSHSTSLLSPKLKFFLDKGLKFSRKFACFSAVLSMASAFSEHSL